MRITQGMLSNNMLNNLMKSQSKMDTYLEQLHTGKKISRPSDDPVIAMKGMNYRGQVAEVDQFKRNISEANSWMDHSDAALDKATKAMHRMRELAVQASNSTYGDQELQSIQEEVQQLKEHLGEIANTKVNGKYIFNGTDTDRAPVQLDQDPPVMNHNTDSVRIEVFNGTRLPVNVDMSEVFNEGFFEAIDQFKGTLGTTGETDEEVDIGNSIADIDTNMDNLIDKRADLGARMNRVELIENRLDEHEVMVTKTMSDNEDIHFEEAITNLITQESLHRASLAAGSRVIQPTLIDFLK